jgi:hypothetical protein
LVRRSLRWTLLALGALSLLLGGASIFAFPDHEVLYSAEPPMVFCTSAGCYANYGLQVGNTGSEAQALVRVRLDRRTLAASATRPTVRAFGKVDRRARIEEADGVRTYALPEMKAGERVEVRFLLPVASRAAAPDWSDILLGVEATEGEVKAGDPGAVTLGRIFYRLFGW